GGRPRCAVVVWSTRTSASRNRRCCCCRRQRSPRMTSRAIVLDQPRLHQHTNDRSTTTTRSRTPARLPALNRCQQRFLARAAPLRRPRTAYSGTWCRRRRVPRPLTAPLRPRAHLSWTEPTSDYVSRARSRRAQRRAATGRRGRAEIVYSGTPGGPAAQLCHFQQEESRASLIAIGVSATATRCHGARLAALRR
ncbi:hypothetical protein AMAG_20732, partial [Allomyces macrogynus ATCC 38327]